MLNLGERFTDLELEELMRDAGRAQDGTLSFEDFKVYTALCERVVRKYQKQ